MTYGAASTTPAGNDYRFYTEIPLTAGDTVFVSMSLPIYCSGDMWLSVRTPTLATSTVLFNYQSSGSTANTWSPVFSYTATTTQTYRFFPRSNCAGGDLVNEGGFARTASSYWFVPSSVSTSTGGSNSTTTIEVNSTPADSAGLFAVGIALVLIFVMFTGYLYNKMTPRKPWQK